jgi:hypothetical protein
MFRRRRPEGASLVLVIGLALVLGLVGVSVFFIMRLVAGGEQMQRAADAGNLTLARAELDQFQVTIPSTGTQLQFNGASDHAGGGNGVVDLRNINSVMGQSFLVNLNAYDITQRGIDFGAAGHAVTVNEAANEIADSLASTMKDPIKTFRVSSAISERNSTAQFSSEQAQPGGGPRFSYVDRGSPSNIYVEPQQMPDYDFTKKSSELFNSKVKSWTATVSSAQDHGKNHYLLGYQDGMTPSGGFKSTYFVPLRPGDRPHLVSQAVFDQNQTPNFNWPTPVANAVSQAITKEDTHVALTQFSSYGQIGPITKQGNPLCIKHGFIRILNGAPAPVSGVANGNNQDVFVYTENHPQRYAKEKSGKPLPYFVGVSGGNYPYGATTAEDYVGKLQRTSGAKRDCGGFAVGYALSGDKLGPGGVSPSNCAQIDGLDGNVINNTTLSQAMSGANLQLKSYNSTDSLQYYARPLLETAYKLSPSRGTGSNSGSFSIGDIVNLALLTARAQGQDFEMKGGQFNAGVADLPSSRTAFAAPNFKIATQAEGANLGSTNQGIKKNGKVWSFIEQRCYEIDPTWTSYCPKNLDSLFEQTVIPLGGRAYIYYSANGNGGKGGLVMKEENAALADSSWLAPFISETPDAKPSTSPAEIVSTPLTAQTEKSKENKALINLDGDWGYPHPYKSPPNIAVLNWFSFTPSSGYNNLLGEVRMGAVDVPGGKACPTSPLSYTIHSGAGASGSDTLSLPAGECDAAIKGTGPG